MIFDASTQSRFADLSGDHNPIHMDPLAARRTPAGAPIVHGIHSLLKLLEYIAETGARQPNARRLKVRFRRPIYIGDEGRPEITQVTATLLRARFVIEGADVIVASIGSDEQQVIAIPIAGDAYTTLSGVPTSPNNLLLEEMTTCSGRLSFESIIAQTETMFPTAVRHFGVQQIAALVCCSRLVGMVVPGLHSLLTGLDVSFFDDVVSIPNVLKFAVTSVDPRFRLVRIGICGGGLTGVLETVSRLPPVRQPSMASLLPLVLRNEFHGSTALIIGGSRGLGELTAKLIASGGGRVVITYATGETDARLVANEITKAGAQCEKIPYDVRRDACEQLAALETTPTHVYYFATPPIFRRKAGLCDLQRFAELNSFYVAGFLNLVQACLRKSPVGIRVFYPSSVAIDTRPADMTEYAMSKVAAEILCNDMQEYLPGVRVITRRLPRLPTDQTSSTLQVENADPTEVLLPIIRELHSNHL